MKKTITILLAAGFALGIYGLDTIKSHIQTTTEGVRNVTRTVTPDQYELRRVQNLIEGMDGKIVRFEDKLHDLAAKADEHREAAETLGKEVLQDTAALERERELLNSGDSAFIVHGRTVCADRIADSAKARLERLRANQSILDTHKQHVADLDAAIADGRAQLEEALRVRGSKELELEQLAVRLENARLKEGIQKMVKPLDNTALSVSDSELAESLEALENRVRKAERSTRSRSLSLQRGPIIEVEVEPAPKEDLLRSIDELLGEGTSTPQRSHCASR